ncbi:MAG: hypothetical protein H6Q73_3751 [Firmicutes bacterium]|nr:hypothetical protein [Bacillota bacterium]
MENIIIGIAACLIFLMIAGLIGYKKKKKADNVISQITNELLFQNPHTELLGPMTYHGGFPPMPKPSVLQMGVNHDNLILYNYQGWSDKVNVRDWCSVEKFTVQKKADYVVGSVTLLGPLVPLFFRDTFKYFITIKYIDIDREENHLVLETGNSKLQEQVYTKLFRHYRKAS